MFRSPEHALAVCYWILAQPIEPKNGTQMVVEMLRERYDAKYQVRDLGVLTPHDWHAQAAMTTSLVERILTDKPLLLAAVQAEYSTGVEMALALQRVADHIAPASLRSGERLVVDALVGNLIRRRPALRAISDKFGVPKSTLHDLKRRLSAKVAQVRQQAIATLDPALVAAGLIVVPAD